MRRHRLLSSIPALICLLACALGAPRATAAESRLALVVGNAAYANSPALANPVHDAKAVGEALHRVGFEVILGTDLDRRAFDIKIRDFARALPSTDVALFFYAGHGLQVANRNFLVPIDAELKSERDVDFEAVAFELVLKQMELAREGKTNIVLLDACLDNPLARNLARSLGTRSASIGQGLADVATGVGTFIAYSTQPGQVALDGKGGNSPFASALAKAIIVPERNITAAMIDVRRDVIAATGGGQVPWDRSALTGDFFFVPASLSGVVPKVAPPAPEAMQERVRRLEEDLRRKSDPQQTADLVTLAQYRERVRQLEEANRADQKRIFDIQYEGVRSSDHNKGRRGNVSFEIGGIQMQIGRRVAEIRSLREKIAALEAGLGLAAQSLPERK
jgi:uncharacterized caspase-like protein